MNTSSNSLELWPVQTAHKCSHGLPAWRSAADAKDFPRRAPPCAFQSAVISLSCLCAVLCSWCTLARVSVRERSQTPSSGRLYLSPLKQGLSRNLEFAGFQPSWQRTGPSSCLHLHLHFTPSTGVTGKHTGMPGFLCGY